MTNKTAQTYNGKALVNKHFFLDDMTGNAFKTEDDRINRDEDFHCVDQIEEFAPVLAAKKEDNDYFSFRHQLAKEICRYWGWNVKLSYRDLEESLERAVTQWKNRDQAQTYR